MTAKVGYGMAAMSPFAKLLWTLISFSVYTKFMSRAQTDLFTAETKHRRNTFTHKYFNYFKYLISFTADLP